ncbi:unnamed protein product [Brassica oleracea]
MSSSQNNSTSSSSTQSSLPLYISRIYKTQFQLLKEQSNKAREKKQNHTTFFLR